MRPLSLIAEELDLRQSGLWLGIIGIFVNFANFKFVWYDPVLTDVTATAFSLAMFIFTCAGSVGDGDRCVARCEYMAYADHVGALLLLFPLYPIMERKTGRPISLLPGLLACSSSALYIFAIFGISEDTLIH